MAAAAPPLLVVLDRDRHGDVGSVVYGTHLDPAALQIRPSPDPFVRWSGDQKVSVLAASGSSILGVVHGTLDMVIHNTAVVAPAPPRLHEAKRRPAILPVEEGTVVVMSTVLRPGSCSFEALRRQPDGSWRADPLPDPPIGYDEQEDEVVEDQGEDEEDFPDPPIGDDEQEEDDEDQSQAEEEEDDDEDYAGILSNYFAIGTRLWISVWQKGTFSLDINDEHHTWRKEGDWELPIKDRGLFLPELGGSIVIGIVRSHIHRDGRAPWEHSCRVCAGDIWGDYRQVCAIDVESRPPTVRHVWCFPAARSEEITPGENVSLAYLGNGRICVSRSIEASMDYEGTSFTVADVTPCSSNSEVRMGKPHNHVWPDGYVGHYFI